MNDKYIEMIKNNDYNSLANILFINDLIKFKYNDKYLLEYLLERNITNSQMDEKAKYNIDFASLYLKYGYYKKLLNCSLTVLLEENQDGIFLDSLLKKINDDEKIELYDNFRIKSYNLYRINESKIVNSFNKAGVNIPTIFISNNSNYDYLIREEDKEIINELIDTFSDQKKEVLHLLINEFKRRLLINHDRAVNDIEKLIEYKMNNKEFTFSISKDTEGSFDKDNKKFLVGKNLSMVFDHELSHFLFQIYENNNILSDYENIRNKIDTQDNIKIIKEYLKVFHQKYLEKKKEYEKEYYNLINQKYGSYDNYILFICKDILNNKDKIDMFIINDLMLPLFDVSSNEEVKDVVLELLNVEKEEYINYSVRRFYDKELMLENMLDALLMGKIADDTEEECLSGHSGIYFMEIENRSFDECLADYDAIVKKDNNFLILKDLERLIGKELIDFLNDYIEKNRENKYGSR